MIINKYIHNCTLNQRKLVRRHYRDCRKWGMDKYDATIHCEALIAVLHAKDFVK